MPETTPRRQPAGYYLRNFEIVLATVAERYDDLLADDELAFLTDFAELSESARRLYVRLLSRKGPCFRRDRLAYPEIPSLEVAISELESAGFVDRGEDAEPRGIIGLLLRAELAEMVSELSPDTLSPKERRPELLAHLIDHVEVEELRRGVSVRLELVRVLRRDLVIVFRLLFFGNLHQDWTEFVLRDLGVVRYEAYELRRDLRLFPDRQAIDDTFHLRGLRSEIAVCLADGDSARAREVAVGVLERIDRWHPSTGRIVDRILNEVGRDLERRGDDKAALELYEAATAPPARERRTRVLARLGSIAQALALCEEIGREPRDETEVDFARHFSHRLRRMRGEPLRPRTRRVRPTALMTVTRREDVPVERLALDALARVGRRGFFAENWLWKSLFGLAFWDIIFSPTGGAFQHPFQFGPLDLHSSAFRSARATAIDQRLEKLRSEARLQEGLMTIYDEKQGIANSLVTWQEDLRADLEWAAALLSGRHLATVCDRLSRDLRRYRRGFPDLFVERDDAPGFELYEVKGPGDQLRPEQRAWIDYLNEAEIPASILRVSWEV